MATKKLSAKDRNRINEKDKVNCFCSGVRRQRDRYIPLRSIKIGSYYPYKQRKGVNEAFFKLKEGEIFWTVRVGKDDWMDVRTQTEAEIIARLVKIERKQDKLERELTKKK